MKKLLLILLLISCIPKKVYYKKDVYTFYIASVDPPKHFSIDVYRLEPSYVFIEDIAGSKWCNGWESIKIGTPLRLTEYLYYYENDPSKKYREIWDQDLHEELCR